MLDTLSGQQNSICRCTSLKCTPVENLILPSSSSSHHKSTPIKTKCPSLSTALFTFLFSWYSSFDGVDPVSVNMLSTYR